MANRQEDNSVFGYRIYAVPLLIASLYTFSVGTDFMSYNVLRQETKAQSSW